MHYFEQSHATSGAHTSDPFDLQKIKAQIKKSLGIMHVLAVPGLKLVTWRPSTVPAGQVSPPAREQRTGPERCADLPRTHPGKDRGSLFEALCSFGGPFFMDGCWPQDEL